MHTGSCKQVWKHTSVWQNSEFVLLASSELQRSLQSEISGCLSAVRCLRRPAGGGQAQVDLLILGPDLQL